MPRSAALPGFSAEQTDALVEVVNIGFGKAASMLSQLVGSFVMLEVPHVERVEIERIPERLVVVAGGAHPFHVVSQAFRPRFRGECLLAVDDDSVDALHSLLNMPRDVHVGRARTATEREAQDSLLEVANILCGALVGKLSEVVATVSTFSAPEVVLWREPVDQLLVGVSRDNDVCLLIHTGFKVERTPEFRGWILILLSHECLDWLRESLDCFAAGET